MDIVERRPPSQYTAELKKLMKFFSYKKNKLELKGSASLASQHYFSDYDFDCSIRRTSPDDFYEFLTKLMERIEENDDLWFLELKLQTTTNKKYRIYPHQKLTQKVFDKAYPKLDFVKLDIVARLENTFTEIGVIYTFTDEPQTTEEYKKSIEQDIKELTKEKRYYKILKRKFNIYKADGDKKQLLRLSKIFNGEMGKEYAVISNLDTIQKVLEIDQDPATIKKIQINLKDLHLPESIDNVEEWVKDRSSKLNEEAKKLL
jgi:hypothetical protein